MINGTLLVYQATGDSGIWTFDMTMTQLWTRLRPLLAARSSYSFTLYSTETRVDYLDFLGSFRLLRLVMGFI